MVDGWASLVGVALLLAAELASWSIEHDRAYPVRARPCRAPGRDARQARRGRASRGLRAPCRRRRFGLGRGAPPWSASPRPSQRSPSCSGSRARDRAREPVRYGLGRGDERRARFGMPVLLVRDGDDRGGMPFIARTPGRSQPLRGRVPRSRPARDDLRPVQDRVGDAELEIRCLLVDQVWHEHRDGRGRTADGRSPSDRR